MLKYFVDKDTQQSVAINTDAVRFVREMAVGPKVVFNDGSNSFSEVRYAIYSR